MYENVQIWPKQAYTGYIFKNVLKSEETSESGVKLLICCQYEEVCVFVKWTITTQKLY